MSLRETVLTTANGPSGRDRRFATRRRWLGLRALATAPVVFGVLVGGSAAPAADTVKAEPAGAESTKAPTLLVQRNINYGPATMDAYSLNDGRKNRPVMVVVHGGGWIEGTRHASQVVAPAVDFAKAGYVSLNIDYPLATETVPGTPMQEAAVIAAIDWAIAHKNYLGIDPTRIATIGGSSGGQVSMQASLLANQAVPGKVTVAVSLSGPVDLWEQIQNLKLDPPDENDDYLPGYHNIEMYLGCTYDVCTAAQSKAASPYYNIDSTCPAVGLTRAEDESLDIANDFVAKVQQEGCAGRVLVVSGIDHGFHHWYKVRTTIVRWVDGFMKG